MQPPPNQQYQTQYVAPPQTQYVVGHPQIAVAQQPGMPMGTVLMGFPQTSAQLALILSIVSIFLGGACLAIPALIIANGALKITSQIPGHPDAGSAKTAQVISWIVIGLTILIVMLYVFLIAAYASGNTGY